MGLMHILTIRTDKPEAEIGLYDDGKQIAYDIWFAHRSLAETIHGHVIALLKAQGLELSDIQGIVCFEGPGSFTGLRIGLTVANTLAYSYDVPIVASVDTENGLWQANGIQRLLSGETDSVVLPKYGAPAITTNQKK